MDNTDLPSWTGKPPEKSSQLVPRSPIADISQSDESRGPSPAQSSNSTGSLEEITYDGIPATKTKTTPVRPADTFDDSEEGSVIEVVPRFQHNFFIDVPTLDEDEKQEYEYLPGHFTVSKIMSEYRGSRYLVKLHSEEKQLVSPLVVEWFRRPRRPFASLVPSSPVRWVNYQHRRLRLRQQTALHLRHLCSIVVFVPFPKTVCYHESCTDC